MPNVYLNFTGQTVATSAAAHAWIQTSAYGQTLTTATTPTQFSDSYGGATLSGGGADDTFAISDSSDQINVSATNVVDTVYAWCSYTLVKNVNNLTLEVANAIGTGNSGNDLLVALATGDTLVAGSGSDVMVDNGAGHESFQIGANATTDVIYGFQASGATADTIQLTGSALNSFSQIQSHLSQVGADTLLTLSPTQEVLIRNTQMGALTAANFATSVDLTGVAPSFDGEFNTLSLYNPATGTGTWKTSFLSGNQTGAESWMSRTLRPNNEQEIYVDPNYAGSGTTPLGLNPFSINNGVLTITASKTPTQDLSALHNYQYTSGLLTTQKSFTQTYGYFEMKAELPSGQGVWPAFWMLPADGSWPPELDVMEQIGGKTVYETSHSVNSSGSAIATGFSSYVPNNSTGFHTYGVLWTPTTLAWYVDGVEVATTATPADMNKPMYMLVNLAIGGDWPGSAPSNFTSAQMQVDYVKAYSLSSLGLSGGAAPSSIETGAAAAATTPTSPVPSATPTVTPPTSTPASYAAKAGAALTVSAPQGVLASDADHNGLALSAALAVNGGPAHGTVVLNANGSFTYTPNAGFSGQDSFTYVASDSLSSGTPTKVTLNVGATAPSTTPASYGVKVGGSIAETAAQGVLAGDVDHNGLSLKAALAANGGPAHGALTLNADGSFIYTPNAGFTGTDSFTYVASDSLSSAAPTTVTLNVSAASIVTHTSAYSLREGSPLSVSAASGPLIYDTDGNGLKLSAALTANGAPQHGTLTLNADGSFTYTPVAGFYGADSFTYVASDGVTTSGPVTVGLKVAPLLPVAHTDSYTGGAGHSLSVSAASGVLANDSDPNGLALHASLATNGGPSHGTLTLNADGSFAYTPTAGYAGSDSFKYVATDSLGASAATTVNLTVSKAAPTGNADTYAVTAGTTLTESAVHGVLANDVDNNGLALKAALVAGAGPAHGTVSLNADGSFSYTPDAGFAGVDVFKYAPSDSLSTGYGTLVTLDVGANSVTASGASMQLLGVQSATALHQHG